MRRRFCQGSRRSAIVCVPLALPWLPYIAVAAQTAMFSESLRPAVQHAYVECGGMCGDAKDIVLTYKVLYITPWAAEVYLVTPCSGGMLVQSNQGRSATVIYFKRGTYGWKYEEYDTPWSDCGSAQGNVFPPDPRGVSF